MTFNYRYLYRLLRPDEDETRPISPKGAVQPIIPASYTAVQLVDTIENYVSYGSSWGYASRYFIATSNSIEGVKTFANNTYNKINMRVAIIDRNRLE